MAVLDASKITKAGAVIITTVSSFVLRPPEMTAAKNDGINWKNLATFVVGVLGVYLYSKLSDKNKKQKMLPLFLSLFVISVICYGVVFSNYSFPCNDTHSVISHQAVKQDSVTLQKYNYWLQHSQQPIKEMLAACNCDPQKIWEQESLAVPYLTMLFLYFIILILTTTLIVLCSDLYKTNRQANNEII